MEPRLRETCSLSRRSSPTSNLTIRQLLRRPDRWRAPQVSHNRICIRDVRWLSRYAVPRRKDQCFGRNRYFGRFLRRRRWPGGGGPGRGPGGPGGGGNRLNLLAAGARYRPVSKYTSVSWSTSSSPFPASSTSKSIMKQQAGTARHRRSRSRGGSWGPDRFAGE